MPSNENTPADLGHQEMGSVRPDPSDQDSQESTADLDEKSKRGFQFWAIIVALCIVSLLSAAENTVVVTSLPTIVEKLNIGEDYVWISNVFFLTR